jgi:hypothetical protein
LVTALVACAVTVFLIPSNNAAIFFNPYTYIYKSCHTKVNTFQRNPKNIGATHNK